MRAMILAAGLGERLRPHTLNRAKPTLPFLNVPLLGYSFYYLQQLGLTDLVINTHHLPESIHLASKIVQDRLPNRIQYSHESPNILGSGGGIKLAEPLLSGGGHFLVANGDEVLLAPQGLGQFWQHHLASDAIATLLVCPHPEVGSKFGGIWLDSAQEVIGFGKTRPAEATEGLHYTGYIALSQRIFQHLPQGLPSNILYDGLMSALKGGERVNVFQQSLAWYETGCENDFLIATKHCLDHLANEDQFGHCLREILTYYHPDYHCQQPGIWVSKNCDVAEDALITGPCLIGSASKISSRAKVSAYSVIGDNCRIETQSSIEGSVIGSQISIGENQIVTGQIIF